MLLNTIIMAFVNFPLICCVFGVQSFYNFFKAFGLDVFPLISCFWWSIDGFINFCFVLVMLT
jgi:hypothetical protein